MKWLITLCFASALFAQSVSIDFGKKLQEHSDKSMGIALTSSLLLPGTGEWYLGEKGRAKWLFGSELIAWASLWFSYQYTENQMDRLHQYANQYANAKNIQRTEDHLQLLGQTRSRSGTGLNTNPDHGDSYDQDKLRASDEPNEKYSSEITWNWGYAGAQNNDQHYDTYRNMLQNFRRSKITFQVSLGLMALNRILSLIDTFQLYRQGSGSVALHVIPSPQQIETKLAFSF